MVDEKESYFNYILARIQKLHEGHDKTARIATIKYVRGAYLRPLVKLISLDLDRFWKYFARIKIGPIIWSADPDNLEDI